MSTEAEVMRNYQAERDAARKKWEAKQAEVLKLADADLDLAKGVLDFIPDTGGLSELACIQYAQASAQIGLLRLELMKYAKGDYKDGVSNE